VLRTLYPVEEVIQSEDRFYDYYADTAHAGAAGTKWQDQIDTVTRRLNEVGIDLAGARVLDVSGGPGFLTQHISKLARRAVVTEFSDVAVEGMRKALGVEAVKFDYNADDLAEQVEGPFDVVLVDASVNFARDLLKFARSLRSICERPALAYVTFSTPTLGCCLRWQYDEYTYNILYQPQTVTTAFASAGFRLADAHWELPYHYRSGVGWKLRMLRVPMEAAFRLRAAGRDIGVDHSLYQHSAVHIYRLD